jgi:hypothetical protein
VVGGGGYIVHFYQADQYKLNSIAHWKKLVNLKKKIKKDKKRLKKRNIKKRWQRYRR